MAAYVIQQTVFQKDESPQAANPWLRVASPCTINHLLVANYTGYSWA